MFAHGIGLMPNYQESVMKADVQSDKRKTRSRQIPPDLDGETANESLMDRGLDQGVEFLTKHGFGGAQLRHLFSLNSRQQKFMYIASVAGATVAVTFFSQSLVGRTLKRFPLLRWV